MIPIAISFYLEGVVFDVNTILSGLFHDPVQLAVQVAVANTSTFFFYVGVGFNIGMTTFVGNSVGGKYRNKTINIAACGFIIITCVIIVEVAGLIVF